jgi:hypothetical protein
MTSKAGYCAICEEVLRSISARPRFYEVLTSLNYASLGYAAASLSSPLEEFACRSPRILACIMQLELLFPEMREVIPQQSRNVALKQVLMR